MRMKTKMHLLDFVDEWLPYAVIIFVGGSFGIAIGYLSNPHAYDWLFKFLKGR